VAAGLHAGFEGCVFFVRHAADLVGKCAHPPAAFVAAISARAVTGAEKAEQHARNEEKENDF